jgi:hypothetical protein
MVQVCQQCKASCNALARLSGVMCTMQKRLKQAHVPTKRISRIGLRQIGQGPESYPTVAATASKMVLLSAVAMSRSRLGLFQGLLTFFFFFSFIITNWN